MLMNYCDVIKRSITKNEEKSSMSYAVFIRDGALFVWYNTTGI